MRRTPISMEKTDNKLFDGFDIKLFDEFDIKLFDEFGINSFIISSSIFDNLQ